MKEYVFFVVGGLIGFVLGLAYVSMIKITEDLKHLNLKYSLKKPPDDNIG